MDTDHSMNKKEWQMFNHQKKIDKFFEKNRYYCVCGHTVTIMPKKERTFCKWCGHWVYKDPKEYFKYRMRGYLKDENFTK